MRARAKRRKRRYRVSRSVGPKTALEGAGKALVQVATPPPQTTIQKRLLGGLALSLGNAERINTLLI